MRAPINLGSRIRRTILALVICVISAVSHAAEQMIFYHLDALGSPIAATDESGNLLWREDYRPYGDKIQNAPESAINTRAFTGHPHDDTTGLTYMGARHYDPVIGRFMGVDPAAFDENDPTTFNRYSYVGNNPYRYIDPDGKVRTNPYGEIGAGGYRAANATQGGGGTGGLSTARPQAAPSGTGPVTTNSAGPAPGPAAKGPVLPDSALVCRGGTCSADKFATGSGVTLDASGKLQGVSVNSGVGKTVDQLTVGIPNKQVGVTTVGDVRRVGGDVIPSPTANNPNHCTLCGITPQQAERLMTPTITNPNVR